MKPSFIMEIYKKPISGYEILKYTETNPNKFAIFTFIPSEFGCSNIDIFTAKVYTKEHGSKYSYFDASSYLYDPRNIAFHIFNDDRKARFAIQMHNTDLFTQRIQNISLSIKQLLDEGRMIYLDLLSLYKILLKRTAHIQLEGKNDFAKKEVLKYFDFIITKQWSQFAYLTHIQLHLYLLINADILNIRKLSIGEPIIMVDIYKLDLDSACQVLYYQLNGPTSNVKEKEDILNNIIKDNEILINEIRKTIHEL